MKPTITWIVIADGARARVLQNDGPGKGVHALSGLVFEGDHSSSTEIMADKPGRTFDSVGTARHAMERTTDPHEQLKVLFVRRVARELDDRRESFDRLVLVAPPVALGLLRKSLPAAVAGKITGELAKDLTHLPNSELAGHLDCLLPL